MTNQAYDRAQRKAIVQAVPLFVGTTRVTRSAGIFFGLLLFLLIAFLTGCDQEAVEPDNRGGFCGTLSCNPDTDVTARSISCAVGAFGSLWLQLDNGQYLQPWESYSGLRLQPGQRYKIGFDPVNRDHRYDEVITCHALVPPATAVRVNCIVPLNPANTGCSTMVTAASAVCGPGVWQNTWLRLDDGTWLQPWESSIAYPALQEGHRYRIGYEPVQRDSRYDTAIICMALPPAAEAVRITCIEEILPPVSPKGN